MRRGPGRASSAPFAVYAVFVLTGAVTTVLGPVLPWIAVRWGVSDAELGFLFTAQFTGSLAAGGASGKIAERVGERPTLVAGALFMSAGVLTLAFAGYGFGNIGALVAGIGMGLVIPTANLLIARVYAHRSTAALAALNLAWGAGAALWPLAVAASSLAGGVPVAVVSLSVALAATAVLLARTVRVVSGGVPSSVALLRPASIRSIVVFGSLIALYSGMESALGGWSVEYTRRLAGAAARVRPELAAAAFWSGLTVGRALVAMGLSDRREESSARAGLVLTICCIVGQLATTSPGIVIALAGVGGLGLAPVFPVTAAALARDIRPAIGGPLIALGGLGGATIPLLVGAASEWADSLRYGLGVVLATAVVVLGLHLVRSHGRDTL